MFESLNKMGLVGSFISLIIGAVLMFLYMQFGIEVDGYTDIAVMTAEALTPIPAETPIATDVITGTTTLP